ncbi:MAG TPA: DUF362 domain-containing protein [Clostridia bacterium]|nr:DUF362 domain-containing protein [Clostridia bacterium]
MRLKTIKRIILIFLTSAMVLAFVGYRYGLFDGFIIKYKEDTTSAPTVIPEETDSIQDKPIEKLEKIAPTAGQSLVAIVQSDKPEAAQITYEEIKIMVENAINLSGGFDEVIKDNQVVVLKPNLVQMHVDSTGQAFDKELNGATTDWRVTRAVVEMVRKYNPHGRVLVMEGSGGDPTRKAMEHLNYTHEKIPGVDEFVSIEEDSGKWQDFDSEGLVKYSLPEGLLHKEYYLNKRFFQCDVLISIPCLKTNSGTVVSGSIKNVSIGAAPANIYGVSATNPGRTQMVSHKIIDGEMDKWLYDYYMCKPIDFVVMDGLQGFQNGPVPIGKSHITGDRMNMRLVMAGKDAIAVDVIEALVMGWDPESITYLQYLSDSGMGKMDTARISVLGKPVDEVRKDFKIRFSNLGGVKVQDRKPPELELISRQVAGNKLNLALNTGEDTTKVEVFIDDKLQLIAPKSDCSNITLDISTYAEGDHQVKILSYDRFMNHSELKTSF